VADRRTGVRARLLTLPERVLAHARAAALFPDRGLALLAVSGGPDSTALARLFAHVGGALELDLAIAHVDHGIHPDSPRWAERVQALGRELGWPVHVTALELGAGTAETAARAARYGALTATRDRTGARYLVTAHHADDQVETVLFRVLRGSAPAGLAGIPAVRGHLVRPLLPFRRAALAPWAEGAIADPANRAPDHDRSWIRATLLPLLRARFGDRLDQHMLDLAAHAAADRAAWDEAAALAPGLVVRVAPGMVAVRRDVLARLPAALAAALLRGLTRQADLVLRPRHAARLVRFAASAEGGRVLELGEGLRAEQRAGTLTIGCPAGPGRVS
jgi:tRNA(Ile)-lysidine synthase